MAFPACAFSAETWAVYWYGCGSNLETEHGDASRDISEMLKARLPDNVTVVIQTGGARKWHGHGISSKKISRYVYRGGKLELVEKQPQASMGSGKTLTSFLAFCRDRYPADHRIFIFWDHGAGSALGLCNDENFDFKSLSLRDVRRAFESTFKASDTKPPFEIIGFDACLMASLDTANTVSGFSRYMIASQEIEPENGWEYTKWLSALGRDTSMSGAALGRIICDSYMAGCQAVDTQDAATLSLVDLSKLKKLKMTYNALGLEAVTKIVEDSSFYATYGRRARSAENYVNNKSEGYSCMVDMGSLVRGLKGSLPEFSQLLLDALKETVVYQVSGRDRKPSGLSCFYPYVGDRDIFRAMMATGNVTSFLILNGLQHGFIDGDEATARLQKIADEISTAVDEEETSPSSGEENAGGESEQPSSGSGTSGPDITGIGAAVAGITSSGSGGQNAGGTSGPDIAGIAGSAVSGITSPGSGGPSSGSGTSVEDIAGQTGSIVAGVIAHGQGGQSSGGESGQSSSGSVGAAVAGIFANGQGESGEEKPAHAPSSQELVALFQNAASSALANVKPLEKLDISSLEDFPISVTDGGDALLDLGPDRVRFIDSVRFYLAYVSEEDDVILLLGKDADMKSDWDKGTFRDNFRGVWASLDDHLVYLEITHEDDDSNRYAVPIKLNGVRCNLQVVYDFDRESYRILGARRAIENNVIDKRLIKLKPGDEVTTILKAMSISGDDDDFQDVEVDTFRLGDKITFEDTEMGDGQFLFMFEMRDVQGNTATSKLAHIEVKGDDITVTED